MNILMAVDGSEYTVKAATHLAAHRGLFGADLQTASAQRARANPGRGDTASSA